MYQNNQQMRNIKQLNQAIDSLKRSSEGKIANKEKRLPFFNLLLM